MSESAPQPGIGMHVARGAAWMVALRMVIRLLGVVSTVILARLLTPADFGLIALATLLSASIELLGSFNFQIWLVRHPQPSRAHYDTVWTLSVLRGLITAALLVALADPAGSFFDEPRLSDVMLALGLSSVITGFLNVGIVDFQRELAFDRDFRLLLAEKLSGFVVTIALAIWLRSYWALVAGIIASRVASLVLSFTMHPFRPRFGLSRLREGFQFTKWLLVGNVVLLLYNRVDTFVLGRLVTSQLLGLYTMAHEMANMATSELIQPISRVLLPSYAKLMNDRDALRRAVVDGFALILAVGVPCAAGLGLTAGPLVRIALGEQWLDSIPLIQILALYAIATAARGNVGPLLLALGHTRLLTVQAVWGVMLLLPSFYLATRAYGLAGGAVAASVVHTLICALTLHAGLRSVGLTWREVSRAVWRVLAATALMAVPVLAVTRAAETAELPAGVVATLAVGTGALLYPACLLGLWHLCGRPRGVEQVLLDFASARIRG